MKILASRWMLAVVILAHAVSSLPNPQPKPTIDLSENQMVATDLSTDGQFLVAATTNSQLRVYQLVDNNYKFLAASPSCRPTDLSISEEQRMGSSS